MCTNNNKGGGIVDKEFRRGIYETIYGNACEYEKGSDTAYDIDAAEVIPTEMVDFDKFIRDFD